MRRGAYGYAHRRIGNRVLNLLPLKYYEAYRVYKQMKANHWEPNVIDTTHQGQRGITVPLWERRAQTLGSLTQTLALQASCIAKHGNAAKNDLLPPTSP